MFRSRLARLLTAVVASALAFACGDAPTEPEPPFAKYTLDQVDERTLPTSIFEGMVEDSLPAFHLRIDVIEGSLELLPDDRYEHRILVQAYIDGVPDIAGPARWVDRGVVTRPGTGALRFDSNYIENVTFVGTVKPGALSITQDLLRHFHDVGGVSKFRFLR